MLSTKREQTIVRGDVLLLIVSFDCGKVIGSVAMFSRNLSVHGCRRKW